MEKCEYKDCPDGCYNTSEYNNCTHDWDYDLNDCDYFRAFKAGQESVDVVRAEEQDKKDNVITISDEDTDYVTLNLNGKSMSSVYLGNSGDWICDAGCGRFKTKPEAVEAMLKHFELKREDLG